MAKEAKELPPLEALDARYATEVADRAKAIEAAAAEVKAAETMLSDTRQKLAGLQIERTKASFDFDAARRELQTPPAPAPAA
jgi:hypothetical protein